MKKVFLLVFSVFILFACKKENPIVNNPDSELEPISECEAYGMGDKHPKHNELQAILDKYVDKGFPGISALIYKPGEGLWQGAAGYANVEAKEALLTCHVLYSGSVAKMYTVTAALSLYEAGMLNLDDKISQFLSQRLIDSLPNTQFATIRQLMNHTAGIPDHDDEQALEDYFLANNGNLPPAEDQLAYVFDNPRNFEVGTKAQYSSAHTLTLSLVLDSIINQHHSTIISEKIINRLALRQTYYKNESGYPSPDNLVNAYIKINGVQQNISTLAINYCLGSQGDAGIIASAHDYYLFMKNLMEGQILKENTLELMQQSEWLFDDGERGIGLGLGLFILKQNGAIFKLGHSGSTVGGMSHVYYYPAIKGYLVLLTNTLAMDQATYQNWGVDLFPQPNIASITSEIETLLFGE